MSTRTRDEVLAALRETAGAGLSGEELAGRLGVSRVAVGKHVSALRKDGYRIEAVPGRGYRLLGVPDLPLPVEVRTHLRGAEWTRLTGGGVTGSTNIDAAGLAREGVPHGTAVLASEQTAGKGRLGRKWDSGAGGVYVSAVLRPHLTLAELTGLPLAVAWGVAAELEERLGLGGSVRVKWPNDLLLAAGRLSEGGKLGGVLLEISAEADRAEWVVAGVGINVARPARLVPGAAYLGDVRGDAGPPPLAGVAAAVLDGIARGYRLLLESGFAAVREAAEPIEALRGASVRVRDIDGRLVAEGIAAGIDDSGRLLVRTAGADGGTDPHDALVAVSAGDVTLADPDGAEGGSS